MRRELDADCDSFRSGKGSDTWHNPNAPVLAEGPKITIKPVGTRHGSAGEVGNYDG
jgi:hypothetical protein